MIVCLTMNYVATHSQTGPLKTPPGCGREFNTHGLFATMAPAFRGHAVDREIPPLFTGT
jgi:hypothetical protein